MLKNNIAIIFINHKCQGLFLFIFLFTFIFLLGQLRKVIKNYGDFVFITCQYIYFLIRTAFTNNLLPDEQKF
jgi:hypothetical protein